MGWGGVTGQGYGVMGRLWGRYGAAVGRYGAAVGQPWVAMGQRGKDIFPGRVLHPHEVVLFRHLFELWGQRGAL